MKYPLLLVTLAACGGSPNASPDAAGPTPDASAGSGPPVTVYAYYPRNPNGDYRPKAGAIVLFYDATGALVDRKLAGDDGLATGLVPDGGSVTVAPPAGSTGLYTWVGVAPGDHLFTNEVFEPYDPNSGLTLQITLPRDGDAVEYETSFVGGGTIANVPPATGTIPTTGELDYTERGVKDLVAEARHSDGHRRFFVVRDVSVDGTALDLSAHAWTDPTPFSMTMTGIPSGVADLDLYYYGLIGGRTAWSFSKRAPRPAATLALALDTPGAVGDGSAATLTFVRGNERWCAAIDPLPTTIDLGAMMPPAATVTGPDHGVVSWTADGDPSRRAAVALQVYGANTMWRVVLPPDRRSFTLPILPGDVAPPVVDQARTQFLEGAGVGDYAALRTDPAIFATCRWAQRWPSTPGGYRIAREWP